MRPLWNTILRQTSILPATMTGTLLNRFTVRSRGEAGDGRGVDVVAAGYLPDRLAVLAAWEGLALLVRAAGGLSRRWHTPGRPVGTGSAVLCPLCTDCKRWFRCVRHGIRGDNRGVMLCEGWSKGLQMNTAPEKESPGLWRVPQIG